MKNKIDNKRPNYKEAIEEKKGKKITDKVNISQQSSLINLNYSEKKNNPKRSKLAQVKNSKNHNSISISSEDHENILCSPTKYRIQKIREKMQNNKNYNTTKKKKMKSTQSNYLLSTNDTSTKEKHKKIKHKKKFDFELSLNNSVNSKNNIIEDGINIEDYENLFKNINYKKTIIIDKDGNNNLNLGNDSQSFNSDKNSLFLNSASKYSQENGKTLYKQDLASKEDYMKRATSIDIIEEKNRLNEYNRIFNLLNSNIEQFKNIFMENTQFSNNKNNNKCNNNKYNKKQLDAFNLYSPGKKFMQKINISKSEKVLLNIIQNNSHNKFASKNNLDIDAIKKNKVSDPNNNYSFLESCLQDEFYQSLLNNTILEEEKEGSGKNEIIDEEIWDKYDIYERTQNEDFDDKNNQKCFISPRKLINNNVNIEFEIQKKNEKLDCDNNAFIVDNKYSYNRIKKHNIYDDNNNKCYVF